MIRFTACLSLLVCLAGCEAPPGPPVLTGLPDLPGNPGVATPRVNGLIGTPDASRAAIITYGEAARGAAAGDRPGALAAAGGTFTLSFADADIRDVVTEILGTLLRVNFTIDPAVHGTVTPRTNRPIGREELLPALQAVLGQNGAALSQSGSLYRVSAAAAGAAPTAAGVGGIFVPLHYAAAEDLAKVLQPYVGQGGKVIADPGRNALLVVSEGEGRDSLLSLSRPLMSMCCRTSPMRCCR